VILCARARAAWLGHGPEEGGWQEEVHLQG